MILGEISPAPSPAPSAHLIDNESMPARISQRVEQSRHGKRMRRRGVLLILATFLPWLTGSRSLGEEKPQAAERWATVRAILTRACFDCHGKDKQENDLRLDQLDPDLVHGNDAETWHDVLNRINRGEMPPEDAKPLQASEHRVLVTWLTEELRRAAEARQPHDRRVVMRRLTRYEYANTMRDLLGVRLDYSKDLPPESRAPSGFKNDGASLGISPLQIELYLETARRALEVAIVTGEQPKTYHHLATEGVKLRGAKGPPSNYLGVGERFIARMQEFPRRGEILVRVTAGASSPADQPIPQMRVALGLRADVKAPERDLAIVDVTAPLDSPEVYKFRARIEDFPLPGHNPKYPGFQITVYHGTGKPKAAKRNKKQQQAEPPRDPDAPTLFVQSVEFLGPVFDAWPPASHRRIFVESEFEQDDAKYAAVIIERFVARAYRRPAKAADVELLMQYFHQIRSDMPSFEAAIREVLAMALVSPDFLYLVERRKPSEDGAVALNDFELASRLSYFLWSTMPDETLLELAEAGELSATEELDRQVNRMLADSRSRQFVEHFTDQWLDLSALDRVAVNPEYYPNFDDRLKNAMRQETQAFFATVLRENLSCLQLLDSEFAMLNGPLARHYGLPGPRGTTFEKVALPTNSRRGGLLTQGSFLLANSNGEDSHPIKRAVWVLDRLLDRPPAPPPPDVPDLDPSEPSLAGLSLKRQLEVHRTKPACNHCHRGIDPWGVAFENYDAVGRWRDSSTTGNGTTAKRAVGQGRPKTARTPVDASAVLPDGTDINGIETMQSYLLNQQAEAFARSLAKRMLAYALGRTMTLADEPAVDEVTAKLADRNYRLRDFVLEIVQSSAFRTK